jgi:hypothetical protein
MKKIIVTCSLLLIAFMTSVAFAKEEKTKMRIAIVDLIPKGSSKIIAEAVTNLIRSEMIDTGLFTIVERSEMKEILKEQGFQQTGCTDQSCAVQLGKLLSANKILVGEVTGVGKGFIITVRIVDVEKGVSDFSANEKADNADVLDKSVVTLTTTMVERITGVRGAKITIEQETKFGYYTRAIIPGWGQLYVGKKQKGYIFMSSFVVSGGAALGSYFYYLDKRKTYRDLPPNTSKDIFDMRYDEYKTAGNIMLYLTALVSLVYAANWVDILMFTDSPSPTIGAIPFNGTFLSFNLYNARQNFTLSSDVNLQFTCSYRF